MVFIIRSIPEIRVRVLAAFDSWCCFSILVLKNMIERITCNIPRTRKLVNARLLKNRVFWISSKVVSPQKSVPLSCEFKPKIAIIKKTMLTARYGSSMKLGFFIFCFFAWFT